MHDAEVYADPDPARARAALAAPANAGNCALWFAVFAPPAAWSVHLLAAVALHHDYCAALVDRAFRPWGGVGPLLTVLGLAMLALAVIGGVVGWRAHLSVGSDTGRGDTDLDRRRFMARASLLGCALFSFGIVLMLVAPLVLPPAVCSS